MWNPLTLMMAIIFSQACLGHVVSAAVTLDRQNSKEEFVCPSQGGFYPIPGECSSNYYSCIEGVSYPMSCPGSSIFDPNLGLCVPAEFASCNTPTGSPTSGGTPGTSTPKPNPGPFTCPSDFGIFPVPESTCSDQFYQCSNGDAYLKECPEPTIFNPSLTVCDWPYNVPGCG